MESYLMMLYVTLEQESALKNLFLDQGWMFCKPDLSITTDKLGPSVSSVQTGKSSVMFENKPRKSGKRRRDAIQNKPPLVNLSKNIPNPLPVPTNVDQHNEQTFSGFLIETENISKIGELIEGGLQEGVPDMPKNSDSKVKLETTDLNYNNDASDDSEYDVKVSDEDTDVDYSYEEIEGEIANAAKETRAEKSEKDFDVSKEDDLQQKEAKISHGKQYLDGDYMYDTVYCGKDMLHQHKNQVYAGSHDNFPCSYCGASFNIKSSSTRHMNTVHLGILKHTCEECGKQFATRRLLDGHKRSKHYPETKFTCDICEKQFSFRDNLQAHVRICYKKNCKTCEICNENFESIEELDSHLLQKHNVNRKIVCQKCDQTFSSQKCLKSHLKLKHGNHSVYECEECGKKYLYPASLFKHKRRHGHFAAKEPGGL